MSMPTRSIRWRLALSYAAIACLAALALGAVLLATNRLEEVVESGDFGDMYPGWSWTREAYEVSTNGFFQVDVEVYHPGAFGGRDSTMMSLWLYRPESILGR